MLIEKLDPGVPKYTGPFSIGTASSFPVPDYPVLPRDVYNYFLKELDGQWLFDLYAEYYPRAFYEDSSSKWDVTKSWRDFKNGNVDSAASCELMRHLLKDMSKVDRRFYFPEWQDCIKYDLPEDRENLYNYRMFLTQSLAKAYYQIFYAICCMGSVIIAIQNKLKGNYLVSLNGNPWGPQHDPIKSLFIEQIYISGGEIIFKANMHLENPLKEKITAHILHLSTDGPATSIVGVDVKMTPRLDGIVKASDSTFDDDSILGACGFPIVVSEETRSRSIIGGVRVITSKERGRAPVVLPANFMTGRNEVATEMLKIFVEAAQEFETEVNKKNSVLYPELEEKHYMDPVYR